MFGQHSAEPLQEALTPLHTGPASIAGGRAPRATVAREMGTPVVHRLALEMADFFSKGVIQLRTNFKQEICVLK